MSEVSTYVGWMLRPFYRWWWAVVTGIASLAALYGVPDSGLHVASSVAALLILSIGLGTFLTASVVHRGFRLFSQGGIRVVRMQQKSSHFAKGALPVFVLESRCERRTGVLLDIRRNVDDSEVPFVIVKVVDSQDSNRMTATTIHMTPAARRDLRNGDVDKDDLVIREPLTMELAIAAVDADGRQDA